MGGTETSARGGEFTLRRRVPPARRYDRRLAGRFAAVFVGARAGFVRVFFASPFGSTSAFGFEAGLATAFAGAAPRFDFAAGGAGDADLAESGIGWVGPWFIASNATCTRAAQRSLSIGL